MCEPVLVERKDGSLVMFARTGMGYLYRCESTDGGESWGVEHPWCKIAGFDRRELTVEKVTHVPLPMPKGK